jgi:hypothetical protein
MAKGAKTGGRQKDTPNKNNKEFKEKMQACLLGRFGDFEKWIDNPDLAIKDKISAYLKALEFVLPKQKAVEHTGGENALGSINVNFTNTKLPPITSENDEFNDD